MAQTLQVDWNLVRELYNSGLTLKQIAHETGLQVGTIASRASRGNWKATVAQAKAIQQRAKPESGSVVPADGSISKASAKARADLAAELERCLAVLAGTKASQRIETQAKRAGVVQVLSSAAKTIHGWSDGQTAPAIRISLMGTTTIQVDGSNPGSKLAMVDRADQDQIIDCEPVTAPAQG